MKRSLARRIGPQTATTHRLAEAALMAAVFLILVSQELRFEGHEAEKVGLQGILAAVILGVNLAGTRQQIWLKRSHGLGVMHNPLTIATVGLLATALASTLFSLSFTRSFWGSPSRSQGLVSLVSYLILFWQASRLSDDSRTALVPSLLLIAIPLCSLAIVSHYELDMLIQKTARPGSTTGNPNFLSSWLVMVLLYCGPRLYWQRHKTLLAVSGPVLFLILYTLFLTSSRGALLGLCVGSLWMMVVATTLRRKRRALMGIAVAVILTAAGYVVISQSISSSDSLGGVARIFKPYDRVRITTWEGAAELVVRQAEPLIDAGGKPDKWAFLRPFLGYGLDTTEQTYSRLSEASNINRILGELTQVDRFHNLVFDTLVALGWLGVIAWLAIYEAAFYLGLRWLGLIRQGDWWRWLGLQIAGAPVGVLLVAWITPQTKVTALVPAGAAFGAIGAMLFWIGRQAFRSTADEFVELNPCSITIIAILGVASAQWIDNQFGFAQAATQPLWWIMMGLLVRLTSRSASESAVPVPGDRAWRVASFVVGVFLLHSMGATIDSQFITHYTGSVRLLLFLLLVTWLAGTVGATFSQPEKHRRLAVGRALWIPVGWLIFFIAKGIIQGFVAAQLDNALSTPGTLTVDLLLRSFRLLSLSGIAATAIAIGVLAGIDQLRRLKWTQALVIMGFFLIGSIGYLRSYTAATLHNVGNVLASTQQPEARAVANLAFEAAITYAPADSRVRLHWVNMSMDEAAMTSDMSRRAEIREHIDEQMTNILRREPFFVNTKEWAVFSDNYATLFGDTPQP